MLALSDMSSENWVCAGSVPTVTNNYLFSFLMNFLRKNLVGEIPLKNGNIIH